MDTILTEEQKQIKALIKQFCERELDMKRVDEISDKTGAARTVEEVRAICPTDLIEKLHAVGLRQLCVPEKYGGGGAGCCGSLTRAVAIEQAGYSMGVAARLLGLPWVMCSGMSGKSTTEEQKDWFFSQFMAKPSMVVASCVSEPEGCTDIVLPYDEPGVAVQTIAHKEGNEWVINGGKMYSSGGGVADLIRVVTRTDRKAPISQGMSLFWVRKDAPGVSYTPNRLTVGEMVGNAQISYDNVRVPESHLCGEVNKGGLCLKEYGAAKMLVYVDILGHAQRIYDLIVDYARERIQGGKPIIQHANIAAKLGEGALTLEAARAFAYRAACENDQREKAGVPLNPFWSIGTFYHCKKAAWRLCEIAADVHGMVGSTEFPIERFARRVFCWLPVGLSADMNSIQASMGYNEHKIG